MYAGLIILIGIIVIAYIVVFVARQKRRARRAKALAQPFPPEWETILQRNVALYKHLPPALKKQLHDDIKIFLAEKSFEGCDGQLITDEVRVTVSGEACMLLLNRINEDYPHLRTILVYPSVYVAKGITAMSGGYLESDSVRAGESWNHGVVVLAWDYVKQTSRNGKDGHNVVLHEFAHQLDQEDGAADGAPILEERSRYRSWAHVLGREYKQLKSDVERHRKNVMDEYGATNPAEFFAVATETFFEKPRQLQQREPELYEQLKSYYKLDPLSWMT